MLLLLLQMLLLLLLQMLPLPLLLLLLLLMLVPLRITQRTPSSFPIPAPCIFRQLSPQRTIIINAITAPTKSGLLPLLLTPTVLFFPYSLQSPSYSIPRIGPSRDPQYPFLEYFQSAETAYRVRNLEQPLIPGQINK